MPRICLDTSALPTLRDDEPGAERPLDQLNGAEVSLSGKDANAPSLEQAKAAGDVFP